MTERTLTIDDLDAFFAKSPAVAKAKPTKPKLAPVAPPEPKYWIPEAVVLWESSYQCQCGNTAPATPELFVKERMGRAKRLRAIRSPNQYSNLPRFLEQAEPTLIHTCPACFAGGAEYVECQLPLPFPEDLAEFKRGVTAAIVEAFEMLELRKTLDEFNSVPPAERATHRRESAWPGYQFQPDEIAFERGSRHSVYIHSCSSDEGPALPFCYHEDRS
jgi:hypothetical protein